MTEILHARSLRVEYGAFVALHDFSLSLGAGELLGLVGPNGAGKTTALRAMAGLQPLAAGDVSVLGHRVRPGDTVALSSIGFTPDTPGLYEALSVQEFLEFIGRAYGLRKSTIEERSDFWLEQLWLTDKRDSKVQALSRGMRQRLAVARTMLPDPSLILLDEPAAGLDPAGRVQFRKLLANLRDQGKALIVSSHILADLHEYCTHIAIMEAGHVRAMGTVAQVVGGADHRQLRYHGRLAAQIADLGNRLATLPHLFNVEVNGVEFWFDDDAEPAAAAATLRRLVELGLPIASFAPIKADLEQAYLRTGIRQVD